MHTRGTRREEKSHARAPVGGDTFGDERIKRPSNLGDRPRSKVTRPPIYSRLFRLIPSQPGLAWTSRRHRPSRSPTQDTHSLVAVTNTNTNNTHTAFDDARAVFTTLSSASILASQLNYSAPAGCDATQRLTLASVPVPTLTTILGLCRASTDLSTNDTISALHQLTPRHTSLSPRHPPRSSHLRSPSFGPTTHCRLWRSIRQR